MHTGDSQTFMGPVPSFQTSLTSWYKSQGPYFQIPIISPGFIFVQKSFLLGLFSGELIFGGAYYCREFCVQNGLDLTVKTASTNSRSPANSPWVYIREGLFAEGYLRLRFGGLIFGRAYCFSFFVFFFVGGGGGGWLLSEFYGIFTIFFNCRFRSRTQCLPITFLMTSYDRTEIM